MGARRNQAALYILDRLFAGTVAAALLFSAVCILSGIFTSPYFNWNSQRLAWSFSAIFGYNLYYPLDTGPVLARMYGPVSPLIYIPAAIFRTPAAAIIAGSFISACLFFFPMLLMSLNVKRKNSYGTIYILYALSFFVLMTFMSSTLKYVAFNIHADASALGFAALACVFLCLAEKDLKLFPLLLSSLFCALSILSKQTMVPLFIALPLYILLSRGKACFWRYMALLSLSLIGVSLLFCIIFRPGILFDNMFTIPGRQPLLYDFKVPGNEAILLAIMDLVKRSRVLLVIFLALLLGDIRIENRKFSERIRGNPWALFAFVSLLMIPTSIIGRAKFAADVNTLSPSIYFLACAASLLMMRFLSVYGRSCANTKAGFMKLSLIVFLVVLLNRNLPSFLASASDIAFLPRNQHTLSYLYAKEHKDSAYFPESLLSNLLAEGKLYHSLDGLYDRDMSGIPVCQGHFNGYIPKHLRIIALPATAYAPDRSQYVKKYLPAFSSIVHDRDLQEWTIYTKQ